MPYEHVQFNPSLKPKSYQIKGTRADSKILFKDVSIIDGTGRDPYKGDVYIEGIDVILYRSALLIELRGTHSLCWPCT